MLPSLASNSSDQDGIGDEEMNKKTQQTIRNKIWSYLEDADVKHLVNIRRVVNQILEEMGEE